MSSTGNTHTHLCEILYNGVELGQKGVSSVCFVAVIGYLWEAWLCVCATHSIMEARWRANQIGSDSQAPPT